MTTTFPNTFDFIGHNAPSRIECDVFDLVVEGTIPPDLDGTWFRSIPDPQFPPMLGDDTNLSGDGMVSAFVFSKGHVDFKVRYVQTDRWKNERAARRGLYGLYRNPYTDDPSVRGKNMGNGKGNSRGVANTTPVFHAGKLFATKGRQPFVASGSAHARNRWRMGLRRPPPQPDDDSAPAPRPGDRRALFLRLRSRWPRHLRRGLCGRRQERRARSRRLAESAVLRAHARLRRGPRNTRFSRASRSWRTWSA